MIHLRALFLFLSKNKLFLQLLASLQWLAMSKLVALEEKVLQSILSWWKAPKRVPVAWKAFNALEDFVNTWFAEMCQSRHWSFFWITYSFGWIVWRQFFPHPWYSDAMDLVVITFCWSIIPSLVENSMKATQAVQLQKQQDQIELLEDGQEVITKMVTLLAEMSNKILAALKEPTVDIEEEVSSHDDSSETTEA